MWNGRILQKRIYNRDSLILSAYVNEDNVAYLIAYEKNNCFYCWVAAVYCLSNRL